MARRKIDEPSKSYTAGKMSVGGIRTGLLHGTLVKVVLGGLIVIFAVGILFNNIGGGPKDEGTTATQNLPAVVAQVGDETVSNEDYGTEINKAERYASQSPMGDSPDSSIRNRQQAMDGLVQQAALTDAANKAGLSVSEEEIDKKIESQINDAIKAEKGSNEADFRRRMESEHGSEESYREDMRKKMQEARDDISHQLLVEKLQKKVEGEHKITEEDYKRSETKLNLYQIKINPKPATPSAKDPDAEKKKNEEEARKKAEKILADLKKNPTVAYFMAVAKKESEDFEGKKKGGGLGWKKPTELPFDRAMREAVMNADPKDKFIGPVVGKYVNDYNIFLVNGRKLDLPKDYNKKGKKEELIKQYQDRINGEVWGEFQEEAKKKAATEIRDPLLVAYKLQNEQIWSAPPDQQGKLRQEALDHYNEALKGADGKLKTGILYQIAQLYRDMATTDPGAKKKRVETLKEAAGESKGDINIQLELARALREDGAKDKALEAVKEAAKALAAAPPAAQGGYNPADMYHQQIATEYDSLGEKKLADLERKKVKPAPPAPGGMGGMGGMGGIPNNIKINPS